MKNVLLAALLFPVQGLAHPGHGKPDLFHFHEFSDGVLIVAGLVVAVLALWALKR